MDNEYLKMLDRRILETKELIDDFRHQEEIIENDPDGVDTITYMILRKYIYDLEDKLEDLKGRKMTFLNCQNSILEAHLDNQRCGIVSTAKVRPAWGTKEDLK